MKSTGILYFFLNHKHAKAMMRGTLRHSLKNGYLEVSCVLHKLDSVSLQTVASRRIILYFTSHQFPFSKALIL